MRGRAVAERCGAVRGAAWWLAVGTAVAVMAGCGGSDGASPTAPPPPPPPPPTQATVSGTDSTRLTSPGGSTIVIAPGAVATGTLVSASTMPSDTLPKVLVGDAVSLTFTFAGASDKIGASVAPPARAAHDATPAPPAATANVLLAPGAVNLQGGLTGVYNIVQGGATSGPYYQPGLQVTTASDGKSYANVTLPVVTANATVNLSVIGPGPEPDPDCESVRFLRDPDPSNSAQTVDPDRVPLILVHGWEGTMRYCLARERFWDRAADAIKNLPFAGPKNAQNWDPTTTYWAEALGVLESPSSKLAGYQIWVMRYPTNRHVTEAADYLRRQIDARFGGRPVVIVGHSMGGLVAASYATTPSGQHSIAQIISIATPYRGSALADAVGGALWTINPCGPAASLALKAFPRTDGSDDLRPSFPFIQSLQPTLPAVMPRLSAYWGDVTSSSLRGLGLGAGVLAAGACALKAAGNDEGDRVVPLTSSRDPVASGAADAAGFPGYDHQDIILTDDGTAPLARVVARLQSLLAIVPAQPRNLRVTSGDQQTGQPGAHLAAPVGFQITDSRGVGVPRIAIHIGVATGGGTVDGKSAEDLTSDTTGSVSVQWSLGSTSGTQTLTATASPASGGSLTVNATATAGSTTTPPPPVVTAGASLAAGPHSCALVGTQAYCWGAGASGEIGNGSMVNAYQPAAVSGGLSFANIAVGGPFSCGLTTGGQAYCWGDDGEGQLGTGAGNGSSVPVAVPNAPTFVSLSTGFDHACGRTSNGTTYCWGWNREAQAGIGVQSEVSVVQPVSTSLKFTVLALGAFHTCALDASGAAYCWGDDEYGQIGLATAPTPSYSSCVYPAGPFSCALTPVAVQTTQRFVTLAAGSSHTCGITLGGATYCWGMTRGTYVGQSYGLGDGTTNTSPTPIPVAQGLTFTSLVAGSAYTCGLTSSGTAYCWGHNGNGELGDGTTTDRLSPVPVAGNHVFSEIAASASGATTCGRVQSTGAVYCWGIGPFGSVNAPSVNPTPVLISLPSVAPSSTRQVPFGRDRTRVHPRRRTGHTSQL